MENRNTVKRYIESFFDQLDETKSKSSPLSPGFNWLRASFGKSGVTTPTEKLNRISDYIEALESNITQQEITIKTTNKQYENLKCELDNAIKDNSILKASFNKKRVEYLNDIKDRDDNLKKITAHMSTLQAQLNELKQLHNENCCKENKQINNKPQLNEIIKEFKLKQLDKFATISHEFEKALSKALIENVENLERKIEIVAVKEPKQANGADDTKKTPVQKSSIKENRKAWSYSKRGEKKEEAD